MLIMSIGMENTTDLMGISIGLCSLHAWLRFIFYMLAFCYISFCSGVLTPKTLHVWLLLQIILFLCANSYNYACFSRFSLNG
jgi:hypothetical protein